jgi:hypothetical protein
MMFYEPSEFEEFTSKLAQGCVNPPGKVWTNIANDLNNKRVIKQKRLILNFSVAASVALILSFGFNWFINNEISTHPIAQNSETIFSNNTSIPTVQLIPNKIEKNTFIAKITTDTIIVSLEAEQYHKSPDYKIQSNLETINIKKIDQPISKETNLPNLNHILKINSIKENSLRKSILNGWSISGMVSPTFTQVSSFNNYNKPEQTEGLWLWSGEIVFKKKISSWFSIQSGLGISPIGQMVNDLYVIRSNEPDNLIDKLNTSTSLGIVGLNSKYFAVTNYDGFVEYGVSTNKAFNYSKANLEQRLYYLEVPVVFAAKLGNHFPNISIKTGVSAGYLITNEFKLASNLVSISGKNDIKNRYAFSTVSSLEYSLPLGRGVNMLLEPSIKINLIPIEEQAINRFPLTFNMKIGLSLQ